MKATYPSFDFTNQGINASPGWIMLMRCDLRSEIDRPGNGMRRWNRTETEGNPAVIESKQLC